MTIKLREFWKKVMGSDGKNAAALEKKSKEADFIKENITQDLERIKRNIDQLNKDTYTGLKKISRDLSSTTYRIAIATGGKKRGIK